MAITPQNDVASNRERTQKQLVDAVNDLSSNLASDSTLQTGLQELQDLLIELNANINDGVPMTPSDLSTLESITATIVGLPSDYPDAGTHDALEACRLLLVSINNNLGVLHTDLDEVTSAIADTGTLLEQIHDEAVLTSNSLATIESSTTASIVPDLDNIAGSSADVATNTSQIATSTADTASGVDTLHTDLQSIDGHVDGLETLVGTSNTKLEQIRVLAAALPTTAPQTDALTNTQLRASAVPVSGPLTDTQLRASAVPVSATAMTDGTQKAQITNGIASVEINAAGDNNALYVRPQTKTTTVTFTSANTSSAAIFTDGYDTIEWIVTAGNALATPQWSNDGVTWATAQWYRWTDVSGPFTSAVTHSTSVRLTAKAQGHYFRLTITTLTTNPTTIDVICSTKPFVPPVQTVSGTVAVTQSTSPWVISDRGATGTPNPVVAMTTTASTVKASNASRKEIIIVNATSANLYLLFAASGTVSSTLYSIKLAAGAQHIEDKYTGLITGVLDAGTGNIMVTEIT